MRIYIPEHTIASEKLRVHVAGHPTDFVQRVGCTIHSLKNWMNGYNRPSREWRARLATAVGIDEGDWFTPSPDVRAHAADAR